jgi:hypothetical protein
MNRTVATVPATVTVPPGATSASFTVSTLRQVKNTGCTIYATRGSSQKHAVLKVLAP